MKLQIEVLDLIKTGMVEISGATFYRSLDLMKFFYAKRKRFSVHLEPNNIVDKNAILFKYNGIPMGYMIKEHAAIYNEEIKLWESLAKQHRTFEYYAELTSNDPYPEHLTFGKKGSKDYISKLGYPITIYTKKD